MPNTARSLRRLSFERALAQAGLAAFALALSGCASAPEIPYTRLVSGCTDPAPVAEGNDGVFVITSSMPDCRDGRNTVLTERRADVVRYAVARMAAGGKPGHAKAQIDLTNAQGWWKALAARVAASDGKVMVYFHGYRNSADDAVRRAAEIRTATRFAGPVVVFVWPSYNRLARYTWDEANNEWTRYYAEYALAYLASISTHVVSVSHSMGNRIALDAIITLDRTHPDLAGRVQTVVMASPDVDRGVFERDLPRLLEAHARKVTVYVSEHDRALQVSWAVHGLAQAGDGSCRRAGARRHAEDEAHCYPIFASHPGLAIVDTTMVSVNNGHADFIESKPGAADLCWAVHGLPPPTGRVPTSYDYVWVLDPAARAPAGAKSDRLPPRPC